MTWLLDTDVLCQPVKTNGNRAVIAWLEREQAECYTSTIVIAQVGLLDSHQRGSSANASASVAKTEHRSDGG